VISGTLESRHPLSNKKKSVLFVASCVPLFGEFFFVGDDFKKKPWLVQWGKFQVNHWNNSLMDEYTPEN